MIVGHQQLVLLFPALPSAPAMPVKIVCKAGHSVRNGKEVNPAVAIAVGAVC